MDRAAEHNPTRTRPQRLACAQDAQRFREPSSPSSTSQAGSPSNPRDTARPAPDPRQALGRLGEELACRFLVDRGYRILARNCFLPGGELDIVASRQGAIIGVEVKTRSSRDFGSPLGAISAARGTRVRRLLLTWARQNAGLGRRLRVEAIGITLRPGREARIEHLIGVA